MDHARTTAEERLEQLSAWLDGELDEAGQATVAAHVEGCDECQHVLADLHAVRALLHTLPAPMLPRSFELPDEDTIGQVAAATVPSMMLAPPSPPMPDAVPEGEEGLSLPGDERAAAFVALEPALVPRPRRAPVWVRVVQQLGGLAAMVGLVLLLGSALLNSPAAHFAASNGAAPYPAPAKMPANAPHGTSSQGSASTATTSTRAPTHGIGPGATYGLGANLPPLGVVIGLALIALGLAFLIGGLLIRRRYRGLTPRATAPPRV